MDASGALTGEALDPDACTAELFSESGSLGSVTGEADAAGTDYVFFRIPDVDKADAHAYVMRATIYQASGALVGTRQFSLATE